MPDTAPSTPSGDSVYLAEEPPTGSVVAIGWGEPHQEVWVSNRSNVGSWYTPDIPMRGDQHPGWWDVKRRAEESRRTLTLLTPADRDTFAAGYDAGVTRAVEAVDSATEELRLFTTGRYPDAT